MSEPCNLKKNHRATTPTCGVLCQLSGFSSQNRLGDASKRRRLTGGTHPK